MLFRFYLACALIVLAGACAGPRKTTAVSGGAAPFIWENANIYFLLTDRFYNGDPSNDVQFGRTAQTAPLRGFMGGDIKGITRKIEEGYFDKLGVTAIWFTPVVEQIHGAVDEGTGLTYGFHGYWAKDWTRLDPSFGSEADLAEMVQKAHRRGIRIILDVVVNHTGPATDQDPVWPQDWVRTTPQCVYKDYESTVTCTLVKNLPDIKTESDKPAELPDFLLEKWKKEGRYAQEMAELDAFFQRTGYPRAPRFYIYKWLTDFVRAYGIDGYRCDTAKHLEENSWSELRREAERAFADWKKAHPAEVLDDTPFFMVGEVYGYSAAGRPYDFGDRKVDFFNFGFNSLINFDFKNDANGSYESLFSKYAGYLQGHLAGKTVLNYASSHDDGGPFDKARNRALETGTKLLLCPGQAQVYYGDESARSLVIPGTQGDATLRSFMNWTEIESGADRNGVKASDVLAHWQKLGQFRKAHPAVGAGAHRMLSAQPYVFQRVYRKNGYQDAVVVGLELQAGRKELQVRGVFQDGAVLRDYYSGQSVTVVKGKAVVDSEFSVVLLGK